MFHYFNSVQNKTGDALTGYFVKAVDPNSGSVVSIYADNSATPIITTSGIANAAQVDSNGNVSFYVASGTYHLDHYAADGTTFLMRVSNVPMIDLTGVVTSTTSRAGLAAMAPTSGEAITVTEQGQEGLFVFSTANLSSQVTADPGELMYVAPGSAPTGASGAWIRTYVWPGYSPAAGGAVIQATSKSTAVTLNTPCGQITTSNSALASGATAAFFLDDSYIASTDTVIVQLQSVVGGAHGLADYTIRAGQISNGSCAIAMTNNNASSLSESLILNFAVIKAVAA